MMKWCIILTCALVFSGCMSRPEMRDNRVEISPAVFVAMPTPGELGYALEASQLVTVEVGGEIHQLPVQLQVDSGRLALAGFSSWGSRIMGLTYEDGHISASVISGLGKTLPEPEQVLFNVMITLWPLEAWNEPLASQGWKIETAPKERRLINREQETVATISYETEPYLDGTMVFMNHPLNLKVTIKTLNYSK